MSKWVELAVAVLAILLAGGCASSGGGVRGGNGGEAGQTIRCAVIGGMMRTGLWHGVAARFEQASGHKVEVVAAGPKDVIAPAMERGQADLLTMHACDAVINLVADGYAVDPQPWARNDLVIVGPADDPAGIRGITDAAEAMRGIVRSDSAFIGHTSLGAQEVLRDLLREADVSLNPATSEIPVRDLGARILGVAAERGAYTLVGRIPFLDGKMSKADLELMVQGDPRLRRPYVVVVANPRRWPAARYEAARALSAFLRRPATQAWLAEFGRGQLDERPLFFPVCVESE